MKKFITYIIPPKKWRIPVIVLFGIFSGLAGYSFFVSNAVSYLSDKPETCVNCHIMAPQYATWNHSAHREVTHCNDCHVPHNNALNKYYFKAKDGLRHATIFTLRNEPQVIQIKDAGKVVVQNNCIRCHANLFDKTKLLTQTKNNYSFHHEQDRLCWECHREVPHGRVNSLTSTPHARVPLQPSPVPDWLKNVMKNKEK